MSKAQQHRHRDHDEQSRPVRESCDSLVQAEHSLADFRQGMEGHDEPGRHDHERARGRKQGHNAAVEADAPKGATREHRDEADAGDRQRKATLKAATSSIPRRRDAECRQWDDSADGHGSSPPETPTATSERRLSPWSRAWW